jgi:hypothetical protein
MIIIKSEEAAKLEVQAAKRFPLSQNVNFKNLDSSGLLPESWLDEGEREQYSKTHPFLRPNTQRQPPNYMRWMWHPQSGDMLIDANGQQHALTYENYRRKMKAQGVDVPPFDAWLRGFYVPSKGKKNDHRLAVRPYYVDQAQTGFAVRPQESDNYDVGAKNFNMDIQSHVRSMLEKGMGKKVPDKNFHTNVDNDWLASPTGFGGIGGRRW